MEGIINIGTGRLGVYVDKELLEPILKVLKIEQKETTVAEWPGDTAIATTMEN